MLPANDIILNSANVLLDEARALNDCAQRLFTQEASREGYRTAIELMLDALNSGGKIVVTGVGKSGKISEKIVATMLSLGIYATFLHPVEALHGDLGVVHANDVVLALSYSGNTDELMRIVPSLTHRNVPLIGLGGNPKSQLAKCSQAWIDAQVGAEVSAIPAPTSSTTLALALGDAIAITLAQQRKFTTHGFALNHPGGSLGRRLLLKVEEAMVPVAQVATVTAIASLDLVIMAMTRHPRSGGVVVVRNLEEEENTLDSPPASDTSEQDDGDDDTQKQMVIGIITHNHIHQILKTAPRESIFDIKAADIMSPEPVVCGTRDLAVEAYKRMTVNRVEELTLLPVIDSTDKRTPLKGVVTLKDLQELF